jgi:glycine cleavage system H protein
MLTGDFFHKLCPNEYECWHCTVDQFVQDTVDAHPYLVKRRERLAKRMKQVKGFAIREDFYYLPNHIWIEVEGETLKIGIDDFAVRLIGKIENIEFTPKRRISRNEQCWRIGSGGRTVSMSLSMDGEIIEKNHLIESDPSLLQKDPYNRGWLLKFKSPKKVGNMMKGSTAEDWLKKEFEKLHQEFETTIGVTITDGGEVVDDLNERLTDTEWDRLIKRFLW